MISVEQALEHLFDLAQPLGQETVPLSQANARILASPVKALRDQPPFAGSAMDGYAICRDDYSEGSTLDVIGESAAGARFEGTIRRGQAVRIFTGAPVPEGADWVVIQEDVTAKNAQITIRDATETNPYIRPIGADFKIGETIDAPRLLTPQFIALLASMNIAEVNVAARPDVALISTGTELVMPGETPNMDQIIASNTFGLKAMLEELGAKVRILPIAHDTLPALRTAFTLARGADLILTIGGASVGDHDLVATVADEMNMQRGFYKVAMRPGKPLMAGKLGTSMMIGLPGNPVSAMVCGTIFVAPVIRALQGLGKAPAPQKTARLTKDMPANGPRAHYMRAQVKNREITAFDRQDSALLTVLAQANALLLRPPHDQARKAGEDVRYVPI